MDKNHKRSRVKSIWIYAVILAVVMTAEYFILTGREKKAEQTDGNIDYQKISVRYGDMAAQIPVRHAGEHEITTLPYGQPVTLVVYLSEACRTCLDSLAEYERISGILGQEDINYVFLFSDRIPVSIAEQYGVSLEQCYTVDSSVELALSTPTWMYLNSDGMIEMLHTDGELVLEKILKSGYLAQEQLQENAQNYLTGHFSETDGEKPVLFYFSMQGCKDCAAADEMIEEQGLEERFEIIRIYTEQDPGQNLISDQLQLFRRVYDLNWYPSFLLVRGETAELIVEQSLGALQERLLREAEQSDEMQ